MVFFLLFAVTCRHLCWRCVANLRLLFGIRKFGLIFFVSHHAALFLHTRVEKHRFLEQIFTFENLVLGFFCGKWRGFGCGYMGLRVRIRHFWVTTHAVVVDKRPICEVPTRGFWGKTRLFPSPFVGFLAKGKRLLKCISLYYRKLRMWPKTGVFASPSVTSGKNVSISSLNCKSFYCTLALRGAK